MADGGAFENAPVAANLLTTKTEMHNPIQTFFSRLSFNYFDFLVLIWLVVGVLRGRKRGMSQELLPTLKWICIVAIAGLNYGFLAALIEQNIGFGVVGANLTAYLLIAIIVHLIFSGLKSAFGEKLVSNDVFGRCEYYFGMTAGCVRFGCMVVALLALMHARIISKEEIAATEKMQRQNFEDIRFPTYGSIQQSFLFQSFSGREVRAHLNSVLITSANSDASRRRPDSMAKREQNTIDEVLGPSKAPKK